jgi:hypothetical protein
MEYMVKKNEIRLFMWLAWDWDHLLKNSNKMTKSYYLHVLYYYNGHIHFSQQQK